MYYYLYISVSVIALITLIILERYVFKSTSSSSTPLFIGFSLFIAAFFWPLLIVTALIMLLFIGIGNLAIPSKTNKDDYFG